MRITNSMLVSHFNTNLNKNLVRMDRYQSQLASNRKIVRISDDPVGVIKSLSARSKISALEQYKRNVEDAKAWLTETETAVGGMNEIIKRAYELTVDLANGIKTDEDRDAIAKELGQLTEQALSYANATFGEKFVFGGYNVTKAPFEIVGGEMIFNGVNVSSPSTPADMAAVADAEKDVIGYDVGFSVDLSVAVNGVTFLGVGEKNIYRIMSELYQTASTPGSDTDDYQQFISRLQGAQQSVLAVQADIGGRQNRLDMMIDNYGQDLINYTTIKSNVEDLDQAEAIMNYSMAEAVYRAALSVGAKIIQPTLLDFLR